MREQPILEAIYEAEVDEAPNKLAAVRQLILAAGMDLATLQRTVLRLIDVATSTSGLATVPTSWST